MRKDQTVKVTRDFEKPGRSLAVGRDGMAATSHPASTLTAVEILKAGGNAMDAAIAACAVQCVVEAGSTGIGGDCFVLYSREGSDDILAYNGSGRAPAAATCEWYVGQGITSIARQSPHAVTIPGAVEAWSRLNRDHGRMKFSDLLAPAIGMARNGYPITPRLAYDIGKQRDLIKADVTSRRIFLVNDEAPAVGQLQYQPELADTMEAIGREGRDAFYRGGVAEDIVAHLRGLGGLHTLEDFAETEGEYVTPIRTDFRGRTIYECPPNGQGIVALMILNILSQFKPKDDPLDIDNLHIEVEATRLAYAARDQWLADPAMSDVSVDYLLSDTFAKKLAAKIDLKQAINPLPVLEGPDHRDTVYIAVVDKDRNAASFINSIFSPYGTGLMGPKSGVLLQNRGQGFVIKAGHPNAIAPRKRPLHTIIPGMVVEHGRVAMTFGVMGGHYQAMGHAHFLAKVFDHDLDLQTAIDLPRLFPLPGTNKVEMEAALSDAVGAEFERRGFQVQAPERPIGGGQAIMIDWTNGTLLGGSDPRKDGCALGF